MGLKIKTITKTYILDDGTKIVKKVEVYEKSSISMEERQARLALRKEWRKQAILETLIDDSGMSNKLDRYTTDHKTGIKVFF